MAGLVWPGVCRYTLNGTYDNNPVANILDIKVDTTGSILSRGEALEDQAGILLTQWFEDIMGQIVNEYVFTSVSWVDLDSASGSTGEVTSGGGHTLPLPGNSAAAGAPGNTAYLFRKTAGNARNTRNGRMYVVGVSEAVTTATSPNNIPQASLDAFNILLAQFLGDVNQDGTGLSDFTSQIGVLHTQLPDPSVPPGPNNRPVAVGFSDVESLTLEPVLATQRRRLRRG